MIRLPHFSTCFDNPYYHDLLIKKKKQLAYTEKLGGSKLIVRSTTIYDGQMSKLSRLKSKLSLDGLGHHTKTRCFAERHIPLQTPHLVSDGLSTHFSTMLKLLFS